MVTTAVYAGSFDPITRGHEDLIRRSCEFVDHLIVAVAVNSAKKALFTTEERVQLIRLATADQKCVEVTQFEGLLVDFAKKVALTQLQVCAPSGAIRYISNGPENRTVGIVETVFMVLRGATYLTPRRVEVAQHNEPWSLFTLVASAGLKFAPKPGSGKRGFHCEQSASGRPRRARIGFPDWARAGVFGGGRDSRTGMLPSAIDGDPCWTRRAGGAPSDHSRRGLRAGVCAYACSNGERTVRCRSPLHHRGRPPRG